VSRSKPSSIIDNPVQILVDWSSKRKCWSIYDRATKTSTDCPATGDRSLKFVTLDMWSSVSGFNKKEKAAYYGTEVKNCAKEQITVFLKKAEFKTDFWANLKAIRGLKFAKIVYAMVVIKDTYQLAKITMSGASSGQWFELVKSIGGERALEGDLVVSVSEVVAHDDGEIPYNSPVFAVTQGIPPDMADQAHSFDVLLQHYLESRAKNSDQPEPESDGYDSEFEDDADPGPAPVLSAPPIAASVASNSAYPFLVRKLTEIGVWPAWEQWASESIAKSGQTKDTLTLEVATAIAAFATESVSQK